MKNTVLYLFIALAPFLTGNLAFTQKPAIDLLPTNHQNQHPEAMVDTLSLGNHIQGKGPFTDSSIHQSSTENGFRIRDRKKKRTGWLFDTFHLKKEPSRIVEMERSENRFLLFKHFRPIQLLIQITALK